MPARPLTSDIDDPVLPGITPATACTGCGTVTPDAVLWTAPGDPVLACCETCAARHQILAQLMADDLF